MKTRWETYSATESAIVNGILHYLSMAQVMAWKTHDAKHKPCHPGITDIMGIIRGVCFAIEVKKDTKQILSDAQIAFRDEFRSHKGMWFLMTTIEDAKKII